MNNADPIMDVVRQRFGQCKELGEGAMRQLQPEDWHFAPTPESTSIAVNVKHLHGNMLSRWTDMLTTDGNKPWRDRDGEFETTGEESPEEIWRWWNEGWQTTLDALAPLTDADLQRSITIRQQPLTVFSGIFRQQGHYNYHIGQIVYVARMRRGADWQTLSIAKGESNTYIAKPTD